MIRLFIVKSLLQLLMIAIIVITSSFQTDNVCLCNSNEKLIVSFQIKNSSKLLSVCEGPKESYLVYRFGKKDKIELEYPEKKDLTSWKKFQYSGYYRGGGFENSAMSLYYLSFSNKGVKYTIFQGSSVLDKEGNENRVVNIEINKDSSFTKTLEGDIATIQGSLSLIKEEKLSKYNPE